MKCYYHNDADGRCAGAIVHQAYESVEKDEKNIFIEVDYKDSIDMKGIAGGEKVIIVDFSFKPEIMNKLLETTSDIIWLDHHKTAFEYEKSYNTILRGLRDDKYSACELAWRFFCHEQKMPRAVELIGDRDKWAWKYGTETAWFNQGLKVFAHQPKDVLWNDLLTNNKEVLQSVIDAGEICIRYRNNFCKDYADSYGFETDFEKHRAYALGMYMFGSEAFGERFTKYPICLSFVYVGDKWVVGLYSKAIDVSKIAKKYGGGGHKGAAGFVCDNLPFAKSPVSV